MAGVVKQDIPEISDFMSDFWKFIKSTWITEDNVEYWSNLIDGVDEIIKKYKDYQDNQFCIMQLRAYVDYLDKKHRGKA